MRRWIVLSMLLCCWTAALCGAAYRPAEVPNVQLADRTRYTSNPDGILSAEAVARIDRICDSLRREGLAQVAVVAVEEIAGDDTFDFAVELFRRWGVGRSQIDNGLGILLVLDRREIRFVTGGGLEGVLPDALCKRIQVERMLPRFREGDYDGGMEAGVAAVAQLLRSGALDFGPEGEEEEPLVVVLVVLILTLFAFGMVGYTVYRQQHRCPNCGKMALQRTGVQEYRIGLGRRYIEETCVCSACGHQVVRRHEQAGDDFNDRGGGGIFLGGGLGGFGGGGGSLGGGFGGGSFGGGGAGSRW